jgi:hypothetical protein
MCVRRFSYADCPISRASPRSQRDRFPSLRRFNAGFTLRIFHEPLRWPQGGIQMSLRRPITDRILELLRGSPECDFEALVVRSPEFTWNELFQEVGRLSRAGQVIITRGVGIFTVKQAAAIK